jgi:hypothetical protein
MVWSRKGEASAVTTALYIRVLTVFSLRFVEFVEFYLLTW